MRGRLLVSVQFGCLLALVLAPSAGAVSSERLVLARFCIGAAGAILGIAFINLRPAVTVMPEPKAGAPFITNGIYAHIRHPMYLAVLLFAAGIALVKWTPVAALLLLALFVDLQVKYRYEDRLLAARWPDAALYQASVGALLPRVSLRP